MSRNKRLAPNNVTINEDNESENARLISNSQSVYTPDSYQNDQPINYRNLTESFTKSCPTCSGTGVVSQGKLTD